MSKLLVSSALVLCIHGLKNRQVIFHLFGSVSSMMPLLLKIFLAYFKVSKYSAKFVNQTKHHADRFSRIL